MLYDNEQRYLNTLVWRKDLTEILDGLRIACRKREMELLEEKKEQEADIYAKAGSKLFVLMGQIKKEVINYWRRQGEVIG